MKNVPENILISFLTDNRYRLARHLLLLFVVEIFAIQNTFKSFEGIGIIYANMVNVLILSGIIYLNIYFLVPRILIKNKVATYVLAVILTIVTAIFLLALLQGIIYRYYGIIIEELPNENPYSFLKIISAFLILGFIITGSSTIVLYQQWNKHRKQKNELEKTTIESELNQLKSRINPHFLFNMLNNANELVMENPSEASRVLSKLNDLLRYQFNDSTQEFVYLSADIRFLTDYLNLEKIRRDKFEFIISKEGDINSVRIPPFLFIPFVENAVKHNVFNIPQPYVHLYFKATDNRLVFICENSKPTTPALKTTVGGLGLDTIKRRLNLLYGENYSLNIENTITTYKVLLTLKT